MRHQLPLQRQLILILVLPALLVLGGLAYFADSAMRQALDISLGERLVAVARSASTIADERLSLLEPGDDDLRIVKRNVQKLQALSKANEVERILILAKGDARILIDTKSLLKVGDQYPRSSFDQSEIEDARNGRSVSSLLFQGEDGRWYKSAYSPLGDEAVITVHAPANFFSSIDNLRRILIVTVIFGVLALILLAFVSAKRVTVPLLLLTEAAQKIGKGKLQTEVPTGGPEETQILGKTMSQMATSLHQRDEEMQMMLGGIAHEVRNPLGGIELFGSLLREDLENEPEKSAHADKILKEIRVLSNVVNDFLAFARKHDITPSRVQLKDLLREVRDVLEADASSVNVSLEIDSDPKLSARLDRASIRAALINVVRNAIQASPVDSAVKIEAFADEDQLCLRITDSGDGIPPDKQNEIFTPFFTTKQKGTGLGLALVRKTIQGHGGQIRYEDNEPQGAKFIIRLPAEPKFEVMAEPGLLD